MSGASPEGDPELLDLDDNLPIADLLDVSRDDVQVEVGLDHFLSHPVLGAHHAIVQL